MWRKVAAEAIGTFFLVLIGPGAKAVDAASAGAVTQVGVALAFALVVFAMVWALADVSGAHINPAVTLALWSVRRIATPDVLPYVIAQCVGAVAAAASLRALLGNAGHLGATIPTIGPWPAAAVEWLLSFALMFVIMASADRPQAAASRAIAPVAIGATVGFCALMGGPLTGASMNPARSLGPALLAGTWTVHWVYWLGPITGMLVAARAYEGLQGTRTAVR